MHKEAETVLRKVAELEPEAIDLMKKLISINSVGPRNEGPGEQEKADFLQEYLKRIGFKNIKN